MGMWRVGVGGRVGWDRCRFVGDGMGSDRCCMGLELSTFRLRCTVGYRLEGGHCIAGRHCACCDLLVTICARFEERRGERSGASCRIASDRLAYGRLA